MIYISRTLSSKYYELCQLHITNSIIYMSRTSSTKYDELCHINIAISIIYISRTLASQYYELCHLHITNSIVYMSRTPSTIRRAHECPFTTQTPTCSTSQVFVTTLTYPVTPKSHELTNSMIHTSRTLSFLYLSRTHRLNNLRSFT